MPGGVSTNGCPVTLREAADEIDTDSETVRSWIESGEVRMATSNCTAETRLSPEDVRELHRYRLLLDIRELFADPDGFLYAPNARMGGYAPWDLIGTDNEQVLIDVVEGIKHGDVS